MEKGKQTILQGALILTASTMVVKVIGALFKIPLANILGGVGMSYFVSAYDVLIPIYSMTVTGLGVAVSRMVSEYGGRGEEVGNILKTARLMFLGIGTLAAVLLFIGAGPLTKLIGNPAAALSVCCIAPSVLRLIVATFKGDRTCCRPLVVKSWRPWLSWLPESYWHGFSIPG